MQAKIDTIEYVVEGIDSSRQNVCWSNAVTFLKHAKNTQFSKAFCSPIVSEKVCAALLRMATSEDLILGLVSAATLEAFSDAAHPFRLNINGDLLRAVLHFVDPELRLIKTTKQQKHITKALALLKTSKVLTRLTLHMDASDKTFEHAVIVDFALSVLACIVGKYKIPEHASISPQQLHECVQGIQRMRSLVDAKHLGYLVSRLATEIGRENNDSSHARVAQCLSILEDGTFPCVEGDPSTTFFDMRQNLSCIKLLFDSSKEGYRLLANGLGDSSSGSDGRNMDVYMAASKVLINLTNKCDYMCSEIATMASGIKRMQNGVQELTTCVPAC